jgi:DNA polymerase III subunit epsilon
MKYAIIDVETTGGSPFKERVIEIAIILHDGEKILEEYSSLINPERYIPYHITLLTGIDNEMVKDAPKFFEIGKKIVELTEGAIFVAHNVRFDYEFVKEEFARLGFIFTRRQLCTVKLTRKIYPGLPSYGLGNLITHFGISVDHRHRALDDTRATTEIFHGIITGNLHHGVIKELVSQGIKEALLPEGITSEMILDIPDLPGVYHFYDENKDLQYIGKSLNIRRRIVEHFSDLSKKGNQIFQVVRSIQYFPTGGELSALVLEAKEIKEFRPPINKVLKTRESNYALYLVENEYLSIRCGHSSEDNVIRLFGSKASAKSALEQITKNFELCRKVNHLEKGKNACFQYGLHLCKGGCISEEPKEDYNERVQQALEKFGPDLEGDFYIIERTGRHISGVKIENGRVVALGTLDKLNQELLPGTNHDSWMEELKPHPEIDRIVGSYLRKSQKVEKITFNDWRKRNIYST